MLKAHPTTSEMKHYSAEEFCADIPLFPSKNLFEYALK